MRSLWPLCFVLVTACGPTAIEGRLQLTDQAASPADCDDGAVGETCDGADTFCGDWVCNGSETCQSCSDDCGVCASAACGNGTCELIENCMTCEADCGVCPPVCGDSMCNGGEDCATCESDCGSCATCGDSICSETEDCVSCESDCGACTWPPDLEASENDMLVLVNQLRAIGANCGGTQYGVVPPLAMHEALRTAARLHSQDMGEQNYFDHQSQDGRSPWARISEAGYPGSGAAENIAAGNNGAQATFNQWLNSPGHCRNMMTAQGNEIGIGHASVSGSQYRDYWTQAFGRR